MSGKTILIIGGHGQVALLATPKLIDAGFTVTSLIRNPEQAAELESLGAKAVVRDLTKLSVQEWADLFGMFDQVLWTAGNGGKDGAEATTQIDRDGALATIDGLELLDSSARPRYLMISYLGSLDIEVEEDGSSWAAYADAKKTVDERLLATDLETLILAPAVLTLEPSQGIKVVANRSGVEGETSRELVADVAVEMLGRDSWPETLAFVDGEDPVSSI